MYRSMSLLIMGIFIFLLFSIGTFAQASFQSLGDLPSGTFTSRAFGVSSDGSVVVGYGTSANGRETFRWTAGGGMVGLGDLPGGVFSSWANGVSSDGSVVVGGSISVNGGEAFRWTAGDGMVGLGDLSGGTFFSEANEVSADGSVVVGVSKSGNGSEAFSWTAGSGMVGLGDLPGGVFSSLAYGVSSDGLVVVGKGESVNGVEAFRWTSASGMVGLGDLPGGNFSSWAYGVSPDGSAVVGVSTSGNGGEAFLWTVGGGMVGLGDLPGGPLSSTAFGVSSDGSVVVGSGFSANGLEAFLWTDSDGMRSLKQILETDYGLDLTGWTLRECRGVSDDGTVVVGWGINPNGDDEAWLAMLPLNVVAWSNAQGGNFSVSSNWVGGTVPDNSQVALFDTSFYTSTEARVNGKVNQPITVTFSEITTTAGLTIETSQIIFDLQAHSYGVDNLSFEGPLGLPDESQLEIINGAFGTTGALEIGTNGTVGQLIISTDGILESSGFIVGTDCGEGEECGRLIIQNGGTVYSNNALIGGGGSQGSVFISGPNSQWADSGIVSLGLYGVGLLAISDQGAFEGTNLGAGLFDSSQGIISVNHSSFILHKTLYLNGNIGPGKFTLSDSSLAGIFGGLRLGFESGEGEFTVEGGSAIAIGDTLFIGDGGSGGLSILDGGKIYSGDAVIPGSTGGIGSALVDGDGSKWDNSSGTGTLWIGYLGVGFVRVTNQGTLETSSINIGPLGSIDASGGKLLIGGTPPPTALSKTQINTNLGDGLSGVGGVVFTDTLLISDGAEVLADSVIFGEGGYLGGEGSFTFDVTNSGGLNPGDSLFTPGLFTIDANYTQLTNGTLFIELEGDLPGSGFDQLVVNGDAQISGTLDVSALNIFEPGVGQTFEILTANNITGTFDDIIGHRGLDVSIAYNSNSIIITVTSPVSVDDENNESIIPTEYSLKQNYPNPFNPSTTIKYSIPKEGFVSLKVYNLVGEEVKTLVNAEQNIGNYNIEFNATALPSGVYFYRIQANSFVETKKMILLK